MKRLKVALIGCGDIAQGVHLPNLMRSPLAEVVAIADCDVRCVDDAGRMVPSARRFLSFEQLLVAGPYDAVIITLPNLLHAVAAKRAIELNIPVYLEKPIAIDESDCGELLDAWRWNQTPVAVGFNYRFNKVFLDLKKLIEQKAAGEITFVRTEFSCTAHSQPDWKKTRRTGGGVLLDLASHHFDLLRFLFQTEIEEVSAQTKRTFAQADTAFVHLRLKNGIDVQSAFSFAAAEHDAIEVHGTDCTFVADRAGAFSVRRYSRLKQQARRDAVDNFLRELSQLPYGFQKLNATRNEPSFQMSLENFLQSLVNKSGASANLYDGMRSLQAVLAAERSAIRGVPVKVRGDYQLETELSMETVNA